LTALSPPHGENIAAPEEVILLASFEDPQAAARVGLRHDEQSKSGHSGAGSAAVKPELRIAIQVTVWANEFRFVLDEGSLEGKGLTVAEIRGHPFKCDGIDEIRWDGGQLVCRLGESWENPQQPFEIDADIPRDKPRVRTTFTADPKKRSFALKASHKIPKPTTERPPGVAELDPRGCAVLFASLTAVTDPKKPAIIASLPEPADKTRPTISLFQPSGTIRLVVPEGDSAAWQLEPAGASGLSSYGELVLAAPYRQLQWGDPSGNLAGILDDATVKELVFRVSAAERPDHLVVISPPAESPDVLRLTGVDKKGRSSPASAMAAPGAVELGEVSVWKLLVRPSAQFAAAADGAAWVMLSQVVDEPVGKPSDIYCLRSEKRPRPAAVVLENVHFTVRQEGEGKLKLSFSYGFLGDAADLTALKERIKKQLADLEPSRKENAAHEAEFKSLGQDRDRIDRLLEKQAEFQLCVLGYSRVQGPLTPEKPDSKRSLLVLRTIVGLSRSQLEKLSKDQPELTDIFVHFAPP